MQLRDNTRQKKSIFVEICLTDASAFVGKMFVPHQDRVVDVLNDDRRFLPVETLEGSVFALAKDTIKQVSLPTRAAPAYQGRDPYMILGIRQRASEDEVRTAYHQACKDNHPDRMRGLGLPPDFLELATQKMVRINQAYIEILHRMKVPDGSAVKEFHSA